VTSQYYGFVVPAVNDYLRYMNWASLPSEKISGYGSGPTVMYDNEKYRMWYMGVYPGRNKTSLQFDTIWYTESSDGFHNWTPSTVALLPVSTPEVGDYFTAGDPTVVKAGNGLYYMYYTSLLCPGCNNGIYLAVSATGNPGEWHKWPLENGEGQTNPKPVINSTLDIHKDPRFYGIGQASAVYVNSTFKIWFTYPYNNKGHTIAYSTSVDGVHFSEPLDIIDCGNVSCTAMDIKYIPSLGIYFMLDSVGLIPMIPEYWSASRDGIHWLPFDKTRTIATGNQCNGLPGMSGNPDGTANTTLIAYYDSSEFYSDSSCNLWVLEPNVWLSKWNFAATTVQISPSIGTLVDDYFNEHPYSNQLPTLNTFDE
jgi:hypothetical protein